MDLTVFLIVLAAALLHATWNAFVKADGDRLVFMAVLMAAGGMAALAATPFLPLPAPESWPYIALSIVLHQGYMAFLLLAYRVGDLSHAYPLARGSAPLIIALLSIPVIGERLSQDALVAIILIGAGIMSLAFTRGAQNLHNPIAVVFALLTGLFIAGYTMTDGIGARLSGSAHGYTAWMMGLQWIPFLAFACWRRRGRIVRPALRIWRPAALMGLLSLAAYWAVIWAMTVAPIALVAGLRETSIVFAVLIGVLVLNERLSLARLAGAFTTLAGVVLLRVGRS